LKPLPLNGQEFDGVMDESRTLYVQGCIVYRDLNGCSHYTDICEKFHHEPGEPQGFFTKVEGRNRTDAPDTCIK
jgi:hypothetical protein